MDAAALEPGDGGSAGPPRRRGPTTLPTEELQGRFVRSREQSKRFRDTGMARAGPTLPLTPGDHAKENLRVVRSSFGQWSIEILIVLVTVSTARFSDLRRTLRGISSDVLSRKLRALGAVGLVERRVQEGRPPAVEYALTDGGLTLTRLGEPVRLFLRMRRFAAGDE